MNTPGGGRRRVERQTGELIGREEEEEERINRSPQGPDQHLKGVSGGSHVTAAHLSCERFGDWILDVPG